ncbi:MAG: RNA methyltransferase [Micrococcales bacterium]|nr:MAG: RNA methyltransferase [Micrococcales bacterium]
MGYDQELAQRIRGLLAGEPGITEKAMFGGLAFMVDGHMAVAAAGQDGTMVHVDEATASRLTERDGIGPMIMRGRPLREWVLADPAVLDDATLAELVALGLGWARSQPPKG